MVHISLNFNLFNTYYYFYERLLVLLFSLVPAFMLVGFVLYTDRKSKEPAKNIIICLLSGMLTVALAGYLEQLVMPYFANNVILTYVWASIEELCKIAVFFLFIFDNKHYDDIYDGVVYMSLIALSFAGLENIMYAFSENTINNSISLALMRDFTTIPLHVICGIVIGYFASLGNFSKNKTRKYVNFTLGIIFASLIHGTFNNLMNVLGNVQVDYNNSIQVLFTQALPLIFIMLALFVVVFIVSRKAVNLNDIFISNGKYDGKHEYLMTTDEYQESTERKRRINAYNKISLHKDNEEKVDEIKTEEPNIERYINKLEKTEKDKNISSLNEENKEIKEDIKTTNEVKDELDKLFDDF